jgi:hypothetical protein
MGHERRRRRRRSRRRRRRQQPHVDTLYVGTNIVGFAV